MWMRTRLIPPLAAVGAATLLISGCGSSGKTAVTGANGQGSTTYRVATISWDPNDIFFKGVKAGEDKEFSRLEKQYGVKIERAAFGANDVAKQTEALRAQLAKGVDGVSLVSWRGEAMGGLLGEIRARNIPVVTHNSYVPGSAQSFVAFDNVKAGEIAAQAVVAKLDANRGATWRKQKGVFFELRCIITISADIERHEGFHKVLDPIVKANPNLSIQVTEAGCDGEKGRKAVDDAISKNGADKIIGIVSIDGTMAVGGAVPALKARGAMFAKDSPRYIPIASVDCSKPELDSITAGALTSCSEQPAVGEGIVAARTLFDLMRNKVLTPKITADQLQTELSKAYGQQPWMPVKSLTPVAFSGTWFGIQTFGVPTDVAVNAPGHWAS